jgi:hypothetical protein
LHYSEGNREATLSLSGRRLVSASCWWDPSYGAPNKGDASVVAAVFTDDHGDYWLHRIRYLKHDPALAEQVDEATQLCRQVAAFARELYLPAVAIETNGLGRFLPSLLRREIAAAGMRCAVIEKVASRQKDLRIIDAFEAVLAAGRLHAHKTIFATPFAGEMRDWQPGGKGRDDGLDAVAGCLLNEPVRLHRRPPDADAVVMGKWRHGHSSIEADTDFFV